MTILTEKFEALEAQLATQHSELITVLGVLNTTLTTMSSAITSRQDTTNSYLDGISGTLSEIVVDYLGQIAVNTENLVNNGSLNAQRLLAAILATACLCNTDVPLLPPPTDTTPISIAGAAKCRRIQYFVDIYQNFVLNHSYYLSRGGSVIMGVPTTLLTQTLLDQEITTGVLFSGLPSGVDSSIVNGISAAIATSGIPAVTVQLQDIAQPDVTSALVSALFAVDNAADGKAAFNAYVSSTSMPLSELFQNMFYSAWANDMYSDVPVVDDSIFDGSLCTGGGAWVDCVDIAGALVTVSYDTGGSSLRYYTPFVSLGLTCISDYDVYHYNQDDAITTDDMYQVKVTLVSGSFCRVIWYVDMSTPHSSNLNSIGQFIIIPEHSVMFTIDNWTTNESTNPTYTVEMCPYLPA